MTNVGLFVDLGPDPGVRRIVGADFVMVVRAPWSSWRDRRTERAHGWTAREDALLTGHRLRVAIEEGAVSVLATGSAPSWETPDWLVCQIEAQLSRIRPRPMPDATRAMLPRNRDPMPFVPIELSSLSLVIGMPMRSGMSMYRAAVAAHAALFREERWLAMEAMESLVDGRRERKKMRRSARRRARKRGGL